MKIAFKLPMADELAAALCSMSDKDAGAAFKAALIYQAGGKIPALPAASRLAFSSMKELIDLSRMKSAAGRAGGNAERFSRRKQTFAGSTAGSTDGVIAGNSDESKKDDFDVLAGLEAFLQ